MDTADTTRTCPFCKEEIKADAALCKHCRSAIPLEKPPHGGTCPYCKEAIHKEAIRCKHCGSAVGPVAGCGCSPHEARMPPEASLAAKAIGGLPGASANPTAMAASTSCGPCQTHYSLVWGGVLSYGTRTCSLRVPVTRPDGHVEIITVYSWTESCGPTQMTAMPF
jgi:hypothetical protein